MATNITDLAFTDGAQIDLVTADGTTTILTTKLEVMEQGVLFEYVETDNTTYRQFMPWHSINRLFQVV